MPNDKPPLTIIVEVNAVRQWGDAQQKSLDTVLYWHAETQPEEIAAIETALRKFLCQIEIGNFRNQPEKENR